MAWCGWLWIGLGWFGLEWMGLDWMLVYPFVYCYECDALICEHVSFCIVMSRCAVIRHRFSLHQADIRLLLSRMRLCC
jgi:hypothetical protein